MKRGFTLIELLIVVAIIAILAAIAVPNFLEAQTRAKVSRVKSDIRSAATALEAYRIDWNAYPYDGYNYSSGSAAHDYNYWFIPIEVSTPIAYITNVSIIDPFRQVLYSMTSPFWHWQWREVRYINSDSTWGTIYDQIQTGSGVSIYLDEVWEEWGGWRLNSSGPDRSYGPTGWPGVSGYPACPQPYDPTNGTVSQGDVQRAQAAVNGYKNVGG